MLLCWEACAWARGGVLSEKEKKKKKKKGEGKGNPSLSYTMYAKMSQAPHRRIVPRARQSRWTL